MTWHTETMISLKDNEIVGYEVHSQSDSLPISILFDSRAEADKLANWLNKRDNWTDRLELIIEHETDIDLEQLKR